MTAPLQEAALDIVLDRSRSVSLVDQISKTLKGAIIEGRLEPGKRLPSWIDLSAQLGVARGTVKAAYEKLADENLVKSAGAHGTRVSLAPPAQRRMREFEIEIRRPLQNFVRGYDQKPLPFQMGVPAHDAFPAKLWSRIRGRALREEAMVPVGQADPRGNPDLRMQIADYLLIVRGIRCLPDQIILTSGFRNGLALAIRTLGVQGKSVWMEEPGYPITRMGLELDGMDVVPVPVDRHGIVVEDGIRLADDAALAVVTPRQQAPTGVGLSADRRAALLDWAAQSGAWIIEDDYLSGLQLSGRAAPALMADDPHGRVIYAGSFSKSLSPALGLGFVAVPLLLAERFGEVAACLQPAPNPTTQLALACFMADGHFLRHLRHMRRIYAERRDDLRACLGDELHMEATGLSIMIRLPDNTDDVALARRALDHNIAPTPLSLWWADQGAAMPGFLLNVANLRSGQTRKACIALREIIGTTV